MAVKYFRRSDLKFAEYDTGGASAGCWAVDSNAAHAAAAILEVNEAKPLPLAPGEGGD